MSEMITGGNYKYWIVVKNDSIKRKGSTFYYFDKNGKWLVFKKYANDEFEKLDRDDILFIETWKLINDTIIDIGAKEYTINKLNDTVFINTDKSGKHIEKLVAAPDSMIPNKYKKIQ